MTRDDGSPVSDSRSSRGGTRRRGVARWRRKVDMGSWGTQDCPSGAGETLPTVSSGRRSGVPPFDSGPLLGGDLNG